MRLDHYVKIGRTEVHWLQILLSSGVIFAASIIVYKILNNSLYKDFKTLELAVLQKNQRR